MQISLYLYILPDMTVRMRHTKGHTANRRSHHALVGAGLTVCQNCGKKAKTHTACVSCGFYRGRKVVDKLAKVEKKQAKKTAKKKSAK